MLSQARSSLAVAYGLVQIKEGQDLPVNVRLRVGWRREHRSVELGLQAGYFDLRHGQVLVVDEGFILPERSALCF